MSEQRVVAPLILSVVAALALGSCATPPGGITGPCPEPPVISPMPETPGEDDWFASAADTVDTYATQLVGFHEDAAETCVRAAGLTWRVIARDGEYFAVTLDYSPQRVKVVIDGSVIVQASAG